MNCGVIISMVVGLVVTILGIVLGWYVFPMVVNDQIAENVVLYEGTDQYDRFVKLPIPLDFKVYIFNVKNPKEVNEGAKPVVEETGPYIYKQSREKTNITWSKDKNRISYYEYLQFEFDEKASGKWKEEDEITVVNPALNGAIQIYDLIGLNFLLPLLNRTAMLTFGANNIFLKTTVKEYLFEGYRVCQVDKIMNDESIDKRRQYGALLVCFTMFVIPTKTIRPNINEENEKELVVSLFDHKNNKHDGRYTIRSGQDVAHTVGLIEQWEDKEYLSTWSGGNESKCNEVRGRDAVIYEPYLNDESTLAVFNTDVCRSLELHFAKHVDFRDAAAIEFQLGANDLRAPGEDNEDEICYCLNVTQGITQDNGCVKDGAMELFTCYNAPILFSFPHFMYADREYKNAVEGMHPELEKHKTFALLEPNTGTPLGGSKRVQFNMYIRDIVDDDGKSLVDFLQNYTEAKLIPIIWLDEGFEITDDLYVVLYDMYISKTYIITGVTWGVIAVGLAVMVGTGIAVLVLKRRGAKETV